MSSALRIVTFGCRLNTYESEVMRLHARDAGLDENAIVFNTCGVTGEAERQARQAIRRARRENPGARIVVTGCAVDIARAKFDAMPEIDWVIANADKLKRATWIGNDDLHETAPHFVTGFEGLARAFVQVQTGCDHACTFCVIPKGRGASRSVPVGDIVAQARTLVERGYNEIVLTGVDITSFGSDLPGHPSLGAMVRRLLALVPDCRRLRLSSLDPAEIDDDLWRLIAEDERVMPHLHLSIQSGDDMVLKRMKRRHTAAGALSVARRARALRPGLSVGADLIAGFPTEDEAMHERTLAFVDEAALTFLHVFAYSPRAGTPAARMPLVDPGVAKARAAALRRAGARQLQAFMEARLGAREDVLVEAQGIGRTAHFVETLLPQGLAVGSVVPLVSECIVGGKLAGHVG